MKTSNSLDVTARLSASVIFEEQKIVLKTKNRNNELLQFTS
jgi:hypothetical protein